jgi:hypothetical protein
MSYVTGSADRSDGKRVWSWPCLVVCVPLWLVLAMVLVWSGRADAFVYWGQAPPPPNHSPFSLGRANLDGTGINRAFIPSLPNGICGGIVTDDAHLYWAGAPGVGRANLDGGLPVDTFINSSNVCGVALDGTHVYWTDEAPTDGIGRANLDGTGIDQQFITGASSPCGVVVDSAHIYWANQGPIGTGTTIGRANLDGSNVDQSFISGASDPCGIAVDGSHVYWANLGSGSIGRANLNGTGVDQNFIPTSSPCGLAVDAGHIYWSTAGQSAPRSLARADLDGTNVENAFVPDLNGFCAVGVDARSLAPTAVLLSVSKDPSTYGDQLFFRAAVADGSSTPTIPTGGVQVAIDGTNVDGPVPLNGGGQAIVALTFPFDVGSTMTASYLGDNNHGASAAQLKPTVRPANTATSLASSANPASEGGDVTITATTRNMDTTVTPFGSVQFIVGGTPVLGPQPLNNHGETGIVGSDLPPGDFAVTANYHDDTAAIPDFVDSQASLTQHVNGQSTQGTTTSSGSVPLSPPIAPIAQAAEVALIAGGHPKTKVTGRTISVDTDEEALCPAGGPSCSATVKAQTRLSAGTARAKKPKRKTITVGAASFNIPAGSSVELVFKLNQRGTKLLRSRKRVSAAVTTTTSVGGGPSHAVVKRLTIRLPKTARATAARDGHRPSSASRGA